MIKEGSVEKAIAAIKAHFMRLFIQDNNILPAVGVLYEMEKGKPVFSLLDHQAMAFESLGTVVQEYVHRLEETRKEWQTKFVSTSDGGMGGGTDDFGGGTDDTFGNDELGGGTDDFGMGNDTLGGGTDDDSFGPGGDDDLTGDGVDGQDGLNGGDDNLNAEPAADGLNAEEPPAEDANTFGAPEPDAEEPAEVKDDEEDEDKLK
jgi:hypothetical protein